MLFLKLFERIYAPLAAGLLRPFPAVERQAHIRMVSYELPEGTEAVTERLKSDILVRLQGLGETYKIEEVSR